MAGTASGNKRRAGGAGVLALACGAALVLSACASDGRFGQFVSVLKGSVPFIGAPKESSVTREQISKLPFATIRISIDGSPFVYLPAVDRDGQDIVYRSVDTKFIYLRGGRLVRTRGFPDELKATAPEGDPVASGLGQVSDGATYSRLVTYDVFDRQNTTRTRPRDVRLNCRITRAGAEKLTILELDFDTIRFDEVCNEPEGRWEHVNQYWIDSGSSQMWRLRQHYHPHAEPMLIEVTKPLG